MVILATLKVVQHSSAHIRERVLERHSHVRSARNRIGRYHEPQNPYNSSTVVEIQQILPSLIELLGAGEEIRTLDPNLGKVVLYH